MPSLAETVIGRQVVLEEHDLAPDGTFAVVCRRFVQSGRYRTHLWVVPLVTGRGARRGHPGRPGRPRQLTSGPVRDTRPRISPDGARVAFRRTDDPKREGDDDPPTRLLVVPVRGGVPREVPVGGRGLSEAEWSPDGTLLAFTAPADPPRFLVGERPAGSPTARRIRRIDWRHDGDGHLDRWDHLSVVPVRRGGQPRRLTDGDFGVSEITWHPDGRSVAFAANVAEDADLEPGRSIWAVPVDGGDPRRILALAGTASSPAFSPDGRWVAAIGVDVAGRPDFVSPGLFVGPADGSAPAVAHAPDLDRPVGVWVDTDLHGWMRDARPGPAWTGPEEVVALVSDRGRTLPWRFPVDPGTGRPAGEPAALATGDAACRSLAAGRGRVSVLATLGSRPVELATVEAGRLRPRTRLGSAWTRGIPWPEMRSVEVPGPGGPIETWIASPAGAGDQPLPTVVDVHGGPLGAWAPAPAIEVVLLCARGYRVVLPNIRGSATYGADWVRPQLGDWGGVDAADVHAALDHVVALGLADPARPGVLGLSYGGFMVNWLVGTTDRFRAAVSENGVVNQVAAWANCDVGPDYSVTGDLGDPLTPEGVEKLWRQSPLRNVAAIRTPLLMLQAEADLRCPPADNEQLFVALRWLRREVEYVLYPDESHVYATTGRPDRRIDRMTRMLDWFDARLRA